MKAIECPQCGAYSVATRETCHECGATLASGGRRTRARSRSLSPRVEASTILIGALAGVFLAAFSWLIFMVTPVAAPLMRQPELPVELILLLVVASSLFLGSLAGGVSADYLLRRDYRSPGGRAVNWGAAAAPATAILLTLPLSLVVITRLGFYAIVILPFVAPPAAVYAVLYAQEHRLLDL